MIAALILVPAVAGAMAFMLRSNPPRRVLLLAAAALHSLLTAQAWMAAPAPLLGGWLLLDPAGKLFLSIASILFLVASVYGVGYLGAESHTPAATDEDEGFLFSNASEAVFIGCLLFFLAAMTLVAVSHHFGILWVAVEATTLASAPLIYFHRHHRSLEATWKYLLICSVGIALALLGNFFLAVAAAKTGGHGLPMVLADLVRHAPQLDPMWLKASFILLLVGYGTKMGLAPLHTWLPDAHSESPSMVSALLSGALLNCAFLGILRVQQVCVAAGLGSFGKDLLLLLGLVSMAVAAVFILGQTDYKRLLAYSSVENMGIVAVGMGLGGAGAFGSLLHAVNHSFTKAMLFLVAGNILMTWKTKTISQVRGLIRHTPLTGALWLAGFLAITGSPPFGPFVSELTILKAAIDQGRYTVGALYLILLGIIFIGMATAFLGMTQGRGDAAPKIKKLSWLSEAPPLALGAVVLLLGVYLPSALTGVLHAAARSLGGL